MHVHILRFSSPADLSWAFGRLLASAWVEDCMAEPEELEICFRAKADHAAELVERIYHHGGLRWASRHRETAETRETAREPFRA